MSGKLQVEFEAAVHDYIHYVAMEEKEQAAAIWNLIVLLAPQAVDVGIMPELPNELLAPARASKKGTAQ